MQKNQSLLTDSDSYQENFNTKCQQWRSQPVSNRSCNDVGCVVLFFIILGGFIAGGAYYISERGNISTDTSLYVSQYAGEIAVCLLVSLVLSFIYVFLIKLMPKGMIYFLIVFSMVLLLGLAVFGFFIGSLGFALPFLITFIIYAIVLACFRKKIDLGITLVKIASQFLSEKWGVFVTPVLKVVLNILFSFFWIYSLGCILSVSDDKSSKGEDDTMEQIAGTIWVLLWFFFSFLFYYIMVFTIAVSCAYWYYRVEGKHYLMAAYKWLFTSAFGSIVFGSLLVALVTFANLIIDSKKRKSKNIAAAICLCICSLCLKNLQSLLRILNHNSVIVMSVTGQNYINSAKTAIGLLSRSFGLMSISQFITGLLVFWGVIIITVVSILFNYFWLASKNLETEAIVMLMIVNLLGSIMISTLVFSVLVEAVGSVFIFYCFDTRFKALGHQSNMSIEITEGLGNVQFYMKQ